MARLGVLPGPGLISLHRCGEGREEPLFPDLVGQAEGPQPGQQIRGPRWPEASGDHENGRAGQVGLMCIFIVTGMRFSACSAA